LLGGGAACLLVLVVSPKAFIVVGPLFALIAFLKFVGWLFGPPPGMKPRSKTAAKESSSSTGEGG
jgi:hypothetical protein